MCLIAFSWLNHPRWTLALIANRDEFHARPTDAVGELETGSGIHGGRDRVSGGGWLQVSRLGRLAAVTNVRDGHAPESGTLRSRGMLVHEFVRDSDDVTARQELLSDTASAYGRFNLLLWDGNTLGYLGNHPQVRQQRIGPGMHAMSNGAFDAHWPKSRLAASALEQWLQSAHSMQDPSLGSRHLTPLFQALRDTRRAQDEQLPDTGVGIALERRLSPAFIEDTSYGTRCSSIVLIDAHDIWFAERRFDAKAMDTGTSLLRVQRGSTGSR